MRPFEPTLVTNGYVANLFIWSDETDVPGDIAVFVDDVSLYVSTRSDDTNPEWLRLFADGSLE